MPRRSDRRRRCGSSRSAGGRGLAGLRLEVEQKGRVQRRRDPRAPSPGRVAAVGAATTRGRDPRRRRPPRPRRARGGRGDRCASWPSARPTWLLRPAPVVQELRLPVRLTPPSLSARLEPALRDAGRLGRRRLPRGPERRARLRDAPATGASRARPLPGGAAGRAGRALRRAVGPRGREHAARGGRGRRRQHRAPSTFVDRFTRRPPAQRPHQRSTTPSSTRWCRRSASTHPGLASKGSLIDDYLQINRELRAANAAELKQLAERSAASFLWSEPFLPLRNGKVMSAFADQRTYVYGGKDVDQQTHLGFDLASTAHSEVQASNQGRRRARALLRHLRKQRADRPRPRPDDAVGPSLRDRGQGGPAGRARRGDRALGFHGPRRRRPSPLHDARSRAAGEPDRVVGREVDP